MAAGALTFYDAAKKYIGDGTMDLNTDTFYGQLFLSTSNCATLTNTVLADLTNEVPTAFGYTQGGQALTSVTYNQVSGIARFVTAPMLWIATGGSIVARYAVIRKNGTANGLTNPLLGFILLDTTPADKTAAAGQPFTVVPDPTDGWFKADSV